MTTPPVYPPSPYANIRISGHVIPAGVITVAATAVRVPDSSRVATAWLADCGQFGAEAVPTPSRVTGRNDMLIAELRALSRAVQALRRDHLDEDMVLLCGVGEAARFAGLWLAGDPVCPEGYALERAGEKLSSLEWLLAELGEFGESYRAEVTAASTGMGGAAKDLARLAARAARKELGRDELREEAAAVVEGVLGVVSGPWAGRPGPRPGSRPTLRG